MTTTELRDAAGFLADRYDCDAASVHEVERGVWSVAYAFDSGGRDLVVRLSCYQIQISLDSCAFNAYRERWDEFDPTMRWVHELVAAVR